MNKAQILALPLQNDARLLKASDTGTYFAIYEGETGASAVEMGNHPYNMIDICRHPYNAKGDAKMRATGSITAGSTTFTDSDAPFAASDVGKYFRHWGSGAGGGYHITTIATYISPTQVTLTNAAITTSNNAAFIWGTDDSVAFQAALDYINSTPNGARPGIYLSKPSFILNGLAHRETTILGLASGAQLSVLASEMNNFDSNQWGTFLFPADPTIPIIDSPNAFGLKIDRIVLANDRATEGTGLRIGPATGGGFGGMNIEIGQITAIGLKYGIRNRHCNEVLIRAYNIIDCTNGIWFGADDVSGGAGHGDVHIIGLQTIRVPYPFNTASGIGMRVTVQDADFNYGIRIARLEALSFFNATTINVENFASTVEHPNAGLIEMFDQSGTVDIRGISFLDTNIPTVVNYSTGSNIRIGGDINSKVIYRTAGREYPDSLPRSAVIERYATTAWTALAETEKASLAYRLPFQIFRDREFRESWTRQLDSGTHPTNNAIGDLQWTRANITGTSYVSFSGDGAGHPGTIDFASGSNTTSAARWMPTNPIGLISGTNYFELDIGWRNPQSTTMKVRLGLYEKEGTADMDPTYGVGILMDSTVSNFIQLEIRVAGVSTLVPTGVLLTAMNSASLRFKIVRDSLGVYLSVRNWLTGAVITGGSNTGAGAFIAAGTVTPAASKVFMGYFLEMTTPTSFPSVHSYGMTFRYTEP